MVLNTTQYNFSALWVTLTNNFKMLLEAMFDPILTDYKSLLLK